ncbi:imidazole glycerol phosphate synthase subunit HisF [Nitrosarchaeum sp.]|nr:imidazole glycerol phosphate synthase subunit HisF [Nitrosarchaeum sp.]
MTLTKRIIPCLDVKNGRVVKGLHFESIKDAGDPVELAEKYSNDGADELVFLDITASDEQRKTIKDLVRKIAKVIDIPFTVGGGVKSLEDARNILLNGADKVGINTGAIKNPPVITELMELFGRQCVVIAIDAKKILIFKKIKISFQRMENNFGLKFSFMVERKQLELMSLIGQKKLKNLVQEKFY